MTGGVLTHFEKFPLVWKGEETVVEDHGVVLALYLKGKALMPKQAQTLEGHTERKDELYADMVESALALATKMRVYARKNNDSILLNVVNYTKTSLIQGSQVDAENRCLLIAQKAGEKVADLAKVKVKQEEIDELKSTIEAYQKAPGERVQAGGERKNATSTLREIVNALREAFVALDDSVYSQIEGNEEFVSTYRLLRRIGKKGTGKTLPKEKSNVSLN